MANPISQSDREAEVFETSDCEDAESFSPKRPEAEVIQGDDKVETTSLAPQHAFERFAGKTYATIPGGAQPLRRYCD